MTDIGDIVAAMKTSGTLAKRATLIYRCQTRSCPMLYVFVTAGERFVHQPRYKLSDEVNQTESVEAARAKHTVDGDRRWKADTFALAQAAGVLRLECDHCRAQLNVESIEADCRAATRQPTTIQMAHNELR